MPDASESRVMLIVIASLFIAAALIAYLGSRIASQSAGQSASQPASQSLTSPDRKQWPDKRQCPAAEVRPIPPQNIGERA